MAHLCFPNRVPGKHTSTSSVYNDNQDSYGNMDLDGYCWDSHHKFTHDIEADTVNIKYRYRSQFGSTEIPYNRHQSRYSVFVIVGTEVNNGVTFPKYELWDTTIALDSHDPNRQNTDNKNQMIHKHSVLKTTEELIEDYASKNFFSTSGVPLFSDTIIEQKQSELATVGSTLAFLDYNYGRNGSSLGHYPVALNTYDNISDSYQRNIHLSSSVLYSINLEAKMKKTATKFANDEVATGGMNIERGFLVNRA